MQSRRSIGVPVPWGFCPLLPLLVAGAIAPVARAEFTVGAEIPAFTLKTPDGQTVTVRPADGALSVQFGEEPTQPAALIVHLLQPDCLQCRAQLETLNEIAERYRERGVVTLGIAHRGSPEDVCKLTESLNRPFPILMGVDSQIARKFAAGDTLGIIDAEGVVRFAQVGYAEGDAQLWQRALDELIAGEPVAETGVDRDRLAVGDHMPAIKLPSLRSGKPMMLVGEGGRLVFRDDEGNESRPKAAVGFFSRY